MCILLKSNQMAHDLSCQELANLLTDYLEEALPDDVRGKFEEHLEHCGYCVAFVDQMNWSIKLTHDLGSPPSPAPGHDELLKLFRDWKSDQS